MLVAHSLKTRLDHLVATTDHAARVAADPIAWVHRYNEPHDQEWAAIIASCLAYGRVQGFFPVLSDLFEVVDAHGGPAIFARTVTPESAATILDRVHRWNHGRDVVLLVDAAHSISRDGSIEHLFGEGPGVHARLAGAMAKLRAAMGTRARRWGYGVDAFEDLPRGPKFLVPSPVQGSACKRWNMFLRWMVRPTDDGVDLGLWRSIGPEELLIPLDTHVARISRFVGLTDRNDAGWRTAESITAVLRGFDAADPIRYDFAIAHLGMSARCTGRRSPDTCPTCPLDPICRAPA